MSNQVAESGQVFVCMACGKCSRDRYGAQAIDHGWDVSCAMNARLCASESLQRDADGRVVVADVVPTSTEEE